MVDIIGKGFSFPLKLDNQGHLALSSGETEIHQAIHIILSTALGERVMRPDFGCRIHELVFAPNNEATWAAAERYIREALGRWEPRINLTKVQTLPDNGDIGTLYILLEYTVKGNPDPRSLVFPFYLLPDQA